MKRSFSFSEQPVQFILKILPTLLPGIEKVIAVFYSPERNGLEATLLKNENGEYHKEGFEVAEAVSILRRSRADNSPYSWLRLEDLPFEVIHKAKVQLTIFNEYSNNILLIRIQNEFDAGNDLYFIYFNKDLSNFGTVNSNKILSTDNKTIIGHIIRNSILAQLKILNEDKEVFLTVHEHNRKIIDETRDYRGKITDLQQKLKSGLSQLCNSYLIEISAKNSKTYKLSDAAFQKIITWDKNFDRLKNLLEKAADYADAGMQEENAVPVIISEHHIFFELDKDQSTTEKKLVTELPGDVPVKYEKTLGLLNRLENAATQLKSQNKALTALNLGKECLRPMSPPAITDALKKHKTKIFYLFKQYPDRWLVIRNEFRPVQNILHAKPDMERLSA